MAESVHGGLDRIVAGIISTITDCALKNSSAIGDLTRDNTLGDRTGALEIIGTAKLLPSEQDIARDGSHHLGKKSAVFCQETDGSSPFGAQPHKWRTA